MLGAVVLAYGCRWVPGYGCCGVLGVLSTRVLHHHGAGLQVCRVLEQWGAGGGGVNVPGHHKRRQHPGLGGEHQPLLEGRMLRLMLLTVGTLLARGVHVGGSAPPDSEAPSKIRGSGGGSARPNPCLHPHRGMEGGGRGQWGMSLGWGHPGWEVTQGGGAQGGMSPRVRYPRGFRRTAGIPPCLPPFTPVEQDLSHAQPRLLRGAGWVPRWVPSPPAYAAPGARGPPSGAGAGSPPVPRF